MIDKLAAQAYENMMLSTEMTKHAEFDWRAALGNSVLLGNPLGSVAAAATAKKGGGLGAFLGGLGGGTVGMGLGGRFGRTTKASIIGAMLGGLLGGGAGAGFGSSIARGNE